MSKVLKNRCDTVFQHDNKTNNTNSLVLPRHVAHFIFMFFFKDFICLINVMKTFNHMGNIR